MFIKASSTKIALQRRSTGVPVAVPWYNEIFDVTQEVVTSKTIILAGIPISGSELVMLNGLVSYKSTDWDYGMMSGNEIIFNNDIELTVGDTIRVKYQA